MKQVLQSLSSGKTEIADVPVPQLRHGHVLIRTLCSLVSPGTERMLVEFGRAGLLGKARKQPDKVAEVIMKVRSDGMLATYEAVRSKLDRPIPLGYSNTGVVLQVGEGVPGFRVGDRVASNGAHAEIVAVPHRLCAKVPETVSDEDASFTVLGAIALNGIRLALPTLGESFAVVGLGLIGQIAVQLLRAHGCRVLGIDFDENRLALASDAGADTVHLSRDEDPVSAAHAFSRGRGVDGVLLTLSSSSNDPIHQAAKMCRKRGRIVLVGVSGLQLAREDFYEKELTFQVSCSYGPGRYDPTYEEQGQDYPLGFVRWTEQRNFEAVLDMLSGGQLAFNSLISKRVPMGSAATVYEELTSNSENLGILLEYARSKGLELPSAPYKIELKSPAVNTTGVPRVSFVGAGNYASRVLIPAFKNADTVLNTIVAEGGLSSAHFGRKFGFNHASSDLDDIASSNDDVVVIATRHNTHAELVEKMLIAGKHVFVEKPLALTLDELSRVEQAAASHADCILMVGYNRRFSPFVRKIEELISDVREPAAFVVTVNAGAIPPEHWTQDPKIGGGRIVGEACHFVDLLRYLAASPIARADVVSLSGLTATGPGDDCASISIQFASGAIGAIHYLSNGHKSVPKERVEVFCGQRYLKLDNFRVLSGAGWPWFRRIKRARQEKGQAECVEAFVHAVSNCGLQPIPVAELIEVAKWSIELGQQARASRAFGITDHSA